MRCIVLTLVSGLVLFAANLPSDNQLSAEEKAQGWQMLFDGKSSNGWEGFMNTPFPKQSWAIEDGAIRTLPDSSGGDLVSVEQFDNFELFFEWKLLERGNSGVKYMVQKAWAGPSFRPDWPESFKKRARLRATGLEYQLLDDKTLNSNNPHSAYSQCGSLYLLVPPLNRAEPQIGEWNTSRIVIWGTHGEHWLNGKRVLSFELNSQMLLDQVQKTKFKNVPGFGIKGRGHIALTHHNSPAGSAASKCGGSSRTSRLL